ncbi:hypothetical protein [Rhodococcus pyridinivorans]|uniref:hypothetical protein n=1 Tax=Rhodococcus pyridinivorans TaxID=103816 RepID=UPI002078FABF|nr:hypothetical protein [Rhodococcus pyridinivorans]USI91363.1 hypothetical protein LLA01_05565 [Rhodococcus pyridinivorans]
MDPQPLFVHRTLDFWDEDSGYRFVAASPEGEPELWAQFLEGARDAYRRFRVEVALEYDLIRDGTSTALFFVAVAADGTVHGGSRALGPYVSATESHPFVEWTDQAARAEIVRILGPCVPYGLVEAKTGWVADGVPGRHELSAGVARTATYFMELLGARFLVGTAADNALEMWRRAEACVVKDVPPTPYPDERYSTRMLLWDLACCDSPRRSIEIEKLLSSNTVPGSWNLSRPYRRIDHRGESNGVVS